MGKILRVYLDNSATTPVDPRVLAEMMPFFSENFGNPASRTHAWGHAGLAAVDEARIRVGNLINCDSREVIWTSGATESNNLAIKGAAQAHSERGRHIVTQATEHKSVLDAIARLREERFDVTTLPVDAEGRVSAEAVDRAIQPNTILVSIMWANNEIGTVQPIDAIGDICRGRDVLFHCDATQAVGKIAIDLRSTNVDLLSFSAHKMYGPKGCGVLFVRHRPRRVRLVPLIDGGGHEAGLRSGTLNVPAIVGCGFACDIARQEMATESARVSELRDQFEKRIVTRMSGVRINGTKRWRLPSISNLCFEGVDAESLMLALKEIAFSSGSACSSANIQPSYVLKALGLTSDEAYESVRFSLGRFTSQKHMDFAVKRLIDAAESLRRITAL